MKLIKVIENDGTVRYINPNYVKEVKITRSEHNSDWCVSIYCGQDVTILCKTESEKDRKMVEILNAMETVQ